MRAWLRHSDLCILGLLIAGVFAFRHGEVAFAALGPRYQAVQAVVTAKLAALADLTSPAAPAPPPVVPAVQPLAPAVSPTVFASPAFSTSGVEPPPFSHCHAQYPSGFGW